MRETANRSLDLEIELDVWRTLGVSDDNRSKRKILLVGNCHTKEIGKCLDLLAPDACITAIVTRPTSPIDAEAVASEVRQADLVLLQKYLDKDLQNTIELEIQDREKLRFFPRLVFSAFHPDFITGFVKSKRLYSGADHRNSIIILNSWIEGLSVEQTLSLFNSDSFKQFGYFDHWTFAKDFLLEQGQLADLPLDRLFEKWKRRGVFFHTPQHPKIFVLADIARALAVREDLETIDISPEELIADRYDVFAWPIYPEVASLMNVKGSGYHWRSSQHVLNVNQMVTQSFKAYERDKHSKDDCRDFLGSEYRSSAELLDSVLPDDQSQIAVDLKNRENEIKNPYKGCPSFQFWHKSVAVSGLLEKESMITSELKITPSTPIATAGSCFAQHVSRALTLNGFNFVSVEDRDLDKKDAAPAAIFSAEYGNIYTARQLLQLFLRAYGRFDPLEDAWSMESGAIVDPFRPRIRPEGFADVSSMRRHRDLHLAKVRTLFETLDVFIFTLGLTECWRSKADGAVFPLAPGVAGGSFRPGKHQFVNLSASEVESDLCTFIELLESVNPSAKLILTVSPVPLVATYEDRHIIVSNTYSKAALRTAAEAVTLKFNSVSYFPSYELIASHYNEARYFEDDLRSVTPEGVAMAMELFFETFALSRDNGRTQSVSAPVIEKSSGSSKIYERRGLKAGYEAKYVHLLNVVCDEEVIADAASPSN